MPAARVKVVPPYSTRGLYVFSVFWGALFGLGMNHEERWAFGLAASPFVQNHLAAWQVQTLALVLTIGAGLLPVAVLALWLSFLSQRLRVTAMAAGLAGMVQLLCSLFADQVLWSVHGGTDWHDWPLDGFLINLAIMGLISAGLALLIRWLVRSVLFTVVEQDGSRCPRCGYQLGSEVITKCPECGTAADSKGTVFGRMSRVGSWAQRRAPWMAAILGAALLVQFGVTLYRRTLPALRFLNAFPMRDDVGPGVMIPKSPPMGSYESMCMIGWVPLEGHPSRAVIVLYVPDRGSSLPAMRLAVAAMPAPKPGSAPGPMVNYGSPEVACDLSRQQSEEVITDGIPRDLMLALADEAERAQWAPSVTPPGVLSPSNQTRWIDPSAYFYGR
jgi:hypothetical protein